MVEFSLYSSFSPLESYGKLRQQHECKFLHVASKGEVNICDFIKQRRSSAPMLQGPILSDSQQDWKALCFTVYKFLFLCSPCPLYTLSCLSIVHSVIFISTSSFLFYFDNIYFSINYGNIYLMYLQTFLFSVIT